MHVPVIRNIGGEHADRSYVIPLLAQCANLFGFVSRHAADSRRQGGHDTDLHRAIFWQNRAKAGTEATIARKFHFIRGAVLHVPHGK